MPAQGQGADFPSRFWFFYKSVHSRVSGTEGRGQRIAHAFSLNPIATWRVYSPSLARHIIQFYFVTSKGVSCSFTDSLLCRSIYRVFWIRRSDKHLKRQITDYRDTTVFFQGKPGKEIGCRTRQRLQYQLNWYSMPVSG